MEHLWEWKSLLLKFIVKIRQCTLSSWQDLVALKRHASLGETMRDCPVHVYRVKTNLKCGWFHSTAWILVWRKRHIAEHGHDLPFLAMGAGDQIPPSLPTTGSFFIMNYSASNGKLCILSQQQVGSDLRVSSMGTNLHGTRRHHANFKRTEAISGVTYDAYEKTSMAINPKVA